jgi:hypothetical protein
LNSRPRKCLGFKTPYQVFFERTGIDARQLGVVHSILVAASYAVDGDTDGEFLNGSTTHTNIEQGAWWQATLLAWCV